MGESEARQIYFPTLKALNAKNVQEVKPYGRYDTGYSLSEEFILTSINPKCENRLYEFSTRKLQVCVVCLHQIVLNLYFSCIELVTQQTICCHILDYLMPACRMSASFQYMKTISSSNYFCSDIQNTILM